MCMRSLKNELYVLLFCRLIDWYRMKISVRILIDLCPFLLEWKSIFFWFGSWWIINNSNHVNFVRLCLLCKCMKKIFILYGCVLLLRIWRPKVFYSLWSTSATSLIECNWQCSSKDVIEYVFIWSREQCILIVNNGGLPNKEDKWL